MQKFARNRRLCYIFIVLFKQEEEEEKGERERIMADPRGQTITSHQF